MKKGAAHAKVINFLTDYSADGPPRSCSLDSILLLSHLSVLTVAHCCKRNKVGMYSRKTASSESICASMGRTKDNQD